MTVRIFVAFDVENDQDLCDRMQAGSGSQGVFEVAARSQGGELTPLWEQKTHARIAGVDQVVVACGEHTDGCEQVAAELRIARELGKPVILLWSRRETMCKKPSGARPVDSMYSWTPEVLRDQLLANQRKALGESVPERLKRVVPTPPTSPVPDAKG